MKTFKAGVTIIKGEDGIIWKILASEPNYCKTEIIYDPDIPITVGMITEHADNTFSDDWNLYGHSSVDALLDDYYAQDS